ncbi:MAG: hypothetical protein M3P22_02770, partial [bacterium]|nr:hypothetical protein [bacterium]
MKKILNKIMKSGSVLMMLAFVLSPFANAPTANAATTWDTTGPYVIDMEYMGTDYSHDMTLAQDEMFNLTGNGGSPAGAGANVYTWVINSGTVVADTINFTANYTATPDAVTPQTVLTIAGTIANDGTMSGTWSDNYQTGARTGTWTSTSGNANAIPVNNPATVKVTINKNVDGIM